MRSEELGMRKEELGVREEERKKFERLNDLF